MAVALVDSLTFTEVAPGVGDVAVSLPAHGDRDLLIVAFTVSDEVDVARRRAPFPSGLVTPPSVFNVDGWATVADHGPLRVLAHLGSAAGLDVPVVGDGGSIDGVALAFTGISENGLAASTSTDFAPASSTGSGAHPGLLYDGFTVAMAATRAEWFTPPAITDSGWTPAAASSTVAVEWQPTLAGSPLPPVWEWTLFSGGYLMVLSNVVGTEAFNDLAVLRSASYAPGVLTSAAAPGDPPAVFTEVAYPSDGVPPDPLPVLTPTEPWWEGL